MKNLMTAIFGKAASTTFLSYINSRFYKGRAPEGTDYPYVVYKVVTDLADYAFQARYEDTIVQFSLFSSNYSSTLEIENMLTYLIAVYDNCSLSPTSETLIWMERTNTAFQPEEHTTKTGTTQVWAYHVDYSVLIRRA